MTKSTADIWSDLASLPQPTLLELFSTKRDGGEGADEPGGAERVAMLSGRIELAGDAEGDLMAPGGILFDWSKTHLDRAVLARFAELAKTMDFTAMRDKLFAGEVVNPTEGRAADHATLRGVGDAAKVEEAGALIDRMGMLVEAIHQGALGEIEHLIHIGIGGSALGPALGVDALSRDFARCDVHVVSNIDGVALEAAFAKCDPAKTLIAVASKTFTTIETMTNAESALKWLGDNGVDDPGGRVIALTANPEGAVEWGVDETRILPFQESVGGRYSIWSSIGFPIAMAVGMDDFREMLAGAAAVDAHFRDTAPEDNLVLRAAFADLYYTRVRGCQTRAVFAYDERLGLFPDYLQQLEMESNGKSVTRYGVPITDYETGPIILGQTGTDAQHAFFQSVHQGTDIIPCDFIFALKCQKPARGHHYKLLANAIAQTKALMDGQENQNPHKIFSGSRPTNTIVVDELDPYHLGMLIAMYEQKVFVQGIIWNINSFDQHGVELGKVLAKQILRDFGDKDFANEKDATEIDSSTAALMDMVVKTHLR